MNKHVKYLSAILSLMFLLSSTSCRQQKQKSGQSPPVKIAVKTAPVIRGNMQDTLSIYGKVKVRNTLLLASQFDGRLTEFSLLAGDNVQKGEQTGIIVPPLREALLHVMGQVPASERKMLSEEIKEIPLVSPAGGTVLRIFHRTGDVVQKGEPIAQIADLKQLDVYADLPVQYLPLVSKQKTMHLEFINYPHPPMLLPVSAFAGKVNPAAQSLQLRLSLPNPKKLFLPGMQVKLWFPGVVHHNTLIIPRSALLEQEGIFHVFVVQNGKAFRRKVTVGIRQNRYVEILSGLHAGEKVVTDKAYSLTDGIAVKTN